MKIGSLYLVKKLYWLLFPTKEVASDAARLRGYLDEFLHSTPAAAYTADCWSKRFNCDVSYFSPDSIVVSLEEEGKFKKFLTSDGRIGWIWLTETYNDSFEEMTM